MSEIPKTFSSLLHIKKLDSSLLHVVTIFKQTAKKNKYAKVGGEHKP
jgi:tRNA splicing ligase